VFLAPEMLKKDLFRLQTSLERLMNAPEAGASDSIYIVPMSNENAENLLILGKNTIITELLAIPLKILL
jgi:hypothetical protein